MPSAGSRKVVIRLAGRWYDLVSETIGRNNLTKRDEEWCVTTWIIDAIRRKINHQERANLQRERKRNKRRMELLNRARALAEQYGVAELQ